MSLLEEQEDCPVTEPAFVPDVLCTAVVQVEALDTCARIQFAARHAWPGQPGATELRITASLVLTAGAVDALEEAIRTFRAESSRVRAEAAKAVH